MFSFTLQQLNLRKAFYWRLGDPFARYGAFREQNHSCLCQESNYDSTVVHPLPQSQYPLRYPGFLCHFINISERIALLVFNKFVGSAYHTLILIYVCLLRYFY